jgi:monothiol glutaredoxin
MRRSPKMALEPATRDRIQSLIDSGPVVLFMKGDRMGPRCGFSAQVVSILEALSTDYVTHDVLSDPEVRQGIKEFSTWPTVPQLYVKGEFVGGCDIVTEMAQSGELEKTLSS